MAKSKKPVATPGPPPVYVSGGASPTVTPDPVQITGASNGLCQFVNNDPNTNYLIELWIDSNSTRIPICILLPKGGSMTFITDPKVPNATLNYNVLVPNQGNSPSNGGHGIIIGSGVQIRRGKKAA